MNTTVYTSIDESAAAWRDFEAEADCWPFQCFDFVEAWLATVGCAEGVEPCIVMVADSAGEPLMLLPLALQKRGPLRTLSWIGGVMADYKAPLIARDLDGKLDYGAFASIWATIRRTLPAHDMVTFDAQPELIGAQRNPFATLSGCPHPSLSHYTRLEGDFDSFLAAKRSSKSRWRLRRKYKRLQELGEVEFVIPETPSEIEAIMRSVIEHKSRLYSELGVRDRFAMPGVREFCLKLATEGPRGLTHVSALTLDGEVVAGHWGLAFRKRFFFLFPSYGEGDVQRLSPGVLLLQHLFQWCFENGIEEFDFTVGDESYKDLWCDVDLELFHHVEATSLMGVAPAAVNSASTRLKRAIKNSDRLWPIAERARSVLGNTVSGLRSQ
jgi:CelD/BcsL family acetyltransferase involved in cellulose biosynthesis